MTEVKTKLHFFLQRPGSESPQILEEQDSMIGGLQSYLEFQRKTNEILSRRVN